MNAPDAVTDPLPAEVTTTSVAPVLGENGVSHVICVLDTTTTFAVYGQTITEHREAQAAVEAPHREPASAGLARMTRGALIAAASAASIRRICLEALHSSSAR